jgi:hypothetical protein
VAAVVAIIAADVVVSVVTTAKAAIVPMAVPLAVLPAARRVKPCQSHTGCTHFKASVSTDAFFISGARALV